MFVLVLQICRLPVFSHVVEADVVLLCFGVPM